MKKSNTKDGRLARLMKVCLALPEAYQENAAQHATFLVRKHTFAYYLNDHHGDGIISVCCKVLPGDNEALIAAHPEKFYMPAYIGPRGWVALRLDVSVDWSEVAELVVTSYKLVAPNRLAIGVNVEHVRAAASHAAKPQSPGRPALRPRTGPPLRRNEPRHARAKKAPKES